MCKIKVKDFVAAREITVIRKKSINPFYREKRNDDTRVYEESARAHTLQAHLRKAFLGSLLKKSLLGKWFSEIQFTMLSHPSTQRPLQVWSKGPAYCFC